MFAVSSKILKENQKTAKVLRWLLDFNFHDHLKIMHSFKSPLRDGCHLLKENICISVHSADLK